MSDGSVMGVIEAFQSPSNVGALQVTPATSETFGTCQSTRKAKFLSYRKSFPLNLHRRMLRKARLTYVCHGVWLPVARPKLLH
jgi:hypothetical protein